MKFRCIVRQSSNPSSSPIFLVPSLMGIKILSLQMITWCFQMMLGGAACPDCEPRGGAAVAPDSGGNSDGGVKLIRADGVVEIYEKPVSASELMILHPNHLLCRSDSFTIGQKIPAIPEEEFLQPGHAYCLLPAHFFQSVLSFATIARATASNGGKLLHGAFDVQRTPSGKLQIKVSEAHAGRTMQVQGVANGGGGRVCTTEALEKDYLKLVAGEKTKQWKPKLETIMETQMGRGRLVSGAMALVGIRRRRCLNPQEQEGEGARHRREERIKKGKNHQISGIACRLNSDRQRRKKNNLTQMNDLRRSPPRELSFPACNLLRKVRGNEH